MSVRKTSIKRKTTFSYCYLACVLYPTMRCFVFFFTLEPFKNRAAFIQSKLLYLIDQSDIFFKFVFKPILC